MDERLRNAERHRLDNPERWLREVARIGGITRLQIEEPFAYFDAMARAGKLGPKNLIVFGLLGCRPAVKAMGGNTDISKEFTCWYREPGHLTRNGVTVLNRSPWYTEAEVLAEAGHGWRFYGNTRHAYRKMLSRMSFNIRQISWMKKIALRLKNDEDMSLDVWLVKREHRTILLAELIGASWTGN